MRNFTLMRFSLLALAICFFSITSFAQSKVVIVQKTQHEDGTTQVIKKQLTDKEDAKDYLRSLENTDAENVDIHVIIDDEATEIEMENLSDEGETIMYIRSAKSCDDKEDEDTEEVKVIMHDFNFAFDRMKDFKSDKIRSDRPFLGIYLDDDGEGILITDIVNGSGAEKAGLQSGDRILSINGNAIDEDSELREELSKYEPGDQVDITFVRDGQQRNTEATLTERRSSYSWERDPCKVFIGVSLGGHGHHDKGVYVSGIISGTPAEASNMQRGDVILALDGVEVNTFNELLVERNKHEPGDYFTLSVLRDGTPVEVNAQFKSCDEPEEEKVEPVEPKQEEEKEPLPEPAPEVESLPEFTFDNTLELEDYSVFPNPSFGDVNVKFHGESVPTVLRVIDVNGKEVYRENLNQFDGVYEKQLNLRNTSAETLYLQIQQGDKTVTKLLQVIPRA